MGITIQHLDNLSRCEEVFGLYRAEAGTLGFMPRGAFDEGIRNRHLLVATDEAERIMGYLLYRVARRRASIAHLCVAPFARDKGVASSLVAELKARTAHLDGITLKCRRDFSAHSMWPKLGFVAKGHTTGRGIDRAEVVIWHIDHNQDDLFSSLVTPKTLVAIDANVFFDLSLPDRPKREISSVLTEPWIDDTIELALTAEIFNDIDRAHDPEMRKASRVAVTAYHELRASVTEVDKFLAELRALYPSSVLLNARDESDIRHLACALAAGVKFFVTRDEGLLSKQTQALEKFDLQLLSPVELISRLDWIEREQEYQPLRLEASSLKVQRLDAFRIGAAIEAFRRHPEERILEFREIIESCLAEPKRCSVVVAQDKDLRMTAMIATHPRDGGQLDIRLLRAAGFDLAPTVVRHMLMQTIRDASAADVSKITVQDRNLSPQIVDALDEVGFAQSGGKWIKLVMRGFVSSSLLSQKLAEIGIVPETDSAADLIWPAKIDDDLTPCYLIPIQAQWAEHFFDTELASQRLPAISGLREELHLGVEAVYYSATNITMTSPGHVLWYVSQGTEGLGSMEVKATSRLREVVHGQPKELFRRFRRLGVYEWRHVFEKAGNNLDAQLLALRFSHTERFVRPVDVKTLASFGVASPFPGPRPVSFQIFKSIYNFASTRHL